MIFRDQNLMAYDYIYSYHVNVTPININTYSRKMSLTLYDINELNLWYDRIFLTFSHSFGDFRGSL